MVRTGPAQEAPAEYQEVMLSTAVRTALDDAVQTLSDRAETLREEFLAARPWPHLVLHDVLPADVVARAEQECTLVAPRAMREVPTRRLRKHEVNEAAALGPAGRALLDTLDGPAWTRLLERVTGAQDLAPDPTHYGAGLHVSGPGAFQMVHTDFTTHPTSGRHHRTSSLIYLNGTWSPAWGGALELWAPDMSALGRTVQPLAGTVVVWETHRDTPHGLPDPVATPDGSSRLSLASYHYAPPPPGGIPRRRPTTFLRRPQDPWWVGLPTRGDLGRAVLPDSAWRRVADLVRPGGLPRR